MVENTNAKNTNKVYVNLFLKGKNNYTGSKDGKYYYVFPSSKDNETVRGDVLYWVLVFRDEATFNKKCAWERVDADMVSSIKEKVDEKTGKTWLSGMLFDNVEKKAYFLGMWDNTIKSPGRDNDKWISLKETEYRERKETPDKTDEENLPF